MNGQPKWRKLLLLAVLHSLDDDLHRGAVLDRFPGFVNMLVSGLCEFHVGDFYQVSDVIVAIIVVGSVTS